MKVVFSHGKESGPWGTKIKTLANVAKQHGYAVDSVDYTGMTNPDERAAKLLDLLQSESQPLILVGSSMGGYVSIVASVSIKCEGLFMLAPALYINGYEQQAFVSKAKHICTVHGNDDDVIPFLHSQKYADASGSELHIIEGDHRLNSSLDHVSAIFNDFLSKIKNGS